MKPAVCRFSISMDPELAEQLDTLTGAKGFANRSQAVAHMVRDELVDFYAHQGRHEVAGTVTLVFDHHHRDLQHRLTNIQHDFQKRIISVMHVHLDHHNCMEVLAVRGPAEEVRKLADRLTTVKGIKHGTLTLTTTGKEFSK
ncbi:MAG: nickel-responsive transcriptional regulator NikR [Candidatus Hydrogenedentes bacterium]|nr:nickel-responsive transcriptional regulator NikR [Candidatus Hydrogenedentota bacterium]